ncbi:hypothetical protein V7014_26790 [Bacillus sp. JJ722]
MKNLEETADLIIYLANLPSANLRPELRLQWAKPFCANIPWFIKEVPTIFISLANPYHLQDIPRVPIYINTYFGNEQVIDCLFDKLTGKSPFKGSNPVDPYCGKWDTRL